MKKKLLPSEYFASYGGVHVRCLSIHESGETFQTDHNIGADFRADSTDYALREAQQQHSTSVEVFMQGHEDHGLLCSVAFVSDMDRTVLEVTTDAITDALRAAVRGVSSAVAVMQ